jgi:hypothetical protein
MSASGSGTKSNPLSLQAVYITRFRNDALSLLWRGYQRLTPANFATAEEDDITGELKKEIKNVLEDINSPQWVERYNVAEQIPANVKGRRGKRRPKIDIEIERSRRGPRPRLPFEAKRLGRGSNVGNYLGSEGLGAFLDGTYPTTHGEAGMLGYVQENSKDVWTTKLSKRLNGKSKRYKITPGGQWVEYKCNQPPSNTFQTIHNDHKQMPIKVLHILLLFH